MIYQIRGRVVAVEEKGVVLDCGGLGYFVHTTESFPLDSEATLYTHFIVKEDSQELFGFATTEARNFFGLLLGVSGIGPRSAFAMLSLYPIGTLAHAIQQGDAKTISSVPGIGKKTAEKVVIDLKDKVALYALSTSSPKSDLVEALMSLGYRDTQIRDVVQNIDDTLPIQKQITIALQLLQK
ncbi:MAG: Holliday junction branch migration protein RuvA [bacterium]